MSHSGHVARLSSRTSNDDVTPCPVSTFPYGYMSMKQLTIILSVFVTVLLFSCQIAKAKIVEVDVTIKSVDVKARGITVVYEAKVGQKTIDLDVSRKAEITINGTSCNLASLRPGQKAKVTFEKELQIVTTINATGDWNRPRPRGLEYHAPAIGIRRRQIQNPRRHPTRHLTILRVRRLSSLAGPTREPQKGRTDVSASPRLLRPGRPRRARR